VKRYPYRGAPWRARTLAPGLARLLTRRDALVELRHGEPPAVVVIGVPHHAAPGVEWIAERRPEGRRVADENAALYALVCFSRLAACGVPCRLLVAAHATDHDPNKLPESPYCRRALGEAGVRLLFECHAAGPRAPHELEISAGRNRHAQPLRFANLLVGALGAGHHVAAQKRPGRSAAVVLAPPGSARESRLRYPALRTRSLSEAGRRGVAALHLEAAPRFRTLPDGTPHLPGAGRHLGRALADAIHAYLRDAR